MRLGSRDTSSHSDRNQLLEPLILNDQSKHQIRQEEMLEDEIAEKRGIIRKGEVARKGGGAAPICEGGGALDTHKVAH
jgi:hypothetical protein